MLVVGRVVRPRLNYGSFADITDAPLVSISATGLEFDGDLTLEQVAAICARMESTDDADQAARAALRAAAAADATNLAAMTCAYVLGDPMPAAVLPEPPPDDTTT